MEDKHRRRFSFPYLLSCPPETILCLCVSFSSLFFLPNFANSHTLECMTPSWLGSRQNSPPKGGSRHQCHSRLSQGMVVIGLTLYRSVRLVLPCCFLVCATGPDVSKWLWIFPGLSPNLVYLVSLMGSRDGFSPSSCRFPSCLFSVSFELQSLWKICILYYQSLWPAFFRGLR